MLSLITIFFVILLMDSGAVNTSEVMVKQEEKKAPSIGYAALAATILNMLLATSPFSLPYALKNGGLALGFLIFIFSSFLAFNSAQMIVESIAVASALKYDAHEESPIKNSKIDQDIVSSRYFIKKKLELFGVCKIMTNGPLTVASTIILCMFMIGSLLIKSISSCQSLASGLSFAIYGTIPEKWTINWISISAVIVFAAVATIFALGNIEGSRPLQLFIMVFRFFLIYLMICGGIYSIAAYGPGALSRVKWFEFKNIGYIISNVLYVTFFHHSVPGVMYPLRPQKYIKTTLFYSYLLQAGIILGHVSLAIAAFDDRENDCKHFPCAINVVYNITFMALPIVGPLVQFFPALGVAVFPVLTITLRNNLMQVFGFASLTGAVTMKTRILWTLGITLPIYIITLIGVSLQFVINITGGFCGLYLLLFLPPILAYYARKKQSEELSQFADEKNIHAPVFKHGFWLLLTLGVGVIVLVFQVYQVVRQFT